MEKKEEDKQQQQQQQNVAKKKNQQVKRRTKKTLKILPENDDHKPQPNLLRQKPGSSDGVSSAWAAGGGAEVAACRGRAGHSSSTSRLVCVPEIT